MDHVYVTAATHGKSCNPLHAACNPVQPLRWKAGGCALSHMTELIEKPAAAALTPQARVDAWLADFEAAMAVRDVERVVAKFAVDSFWRDLVSFTWNIKTVEGRDGVADMLGARLAETSPSGFRTREEPVADGDVTSAFIEF